MDKDLVMGMDKGMEIIKVDRDLVSKVDKDLEIIKVDKDLEIIKVDKVLAIKVDKNSIITIKDIKVSEEVIIHMIKNH